MKKILLSAAVCLAFVACSSDDDNGEENTCKTCEITVLEETQSVEYCDNGDGTVTATAQDGSEVTAELEGVSFSQFISALEQSGYECN